MIDGVSRIAIGIGCISTIYGACIWKYAGPSAEAYGYVGVGSALFTLGSVGAIHIINSDNHEEQNIQIPLQVHHVQNRSGVLSPRTANRVYPFNPADITTTYNSDASNDNV